MLKELGVFLMGAVSIGIAMLLFSVEFPVFDVWALLTLDSPKYLVSLFTAAGVFLLFLYS